MNWVTHPVTQTKRNGRAARPQEINSEIETESVHRPEKGKKSKARRKGKGKRALPENTSSDEDTLEDSSKRSKRAKPKRSDNSPKKNRTSKPKRSDEGRNVSHK